MDAQLGSTTGTAQDVTSTTGSSIRSMTSSTGSLIASTGEGTGPGNEVPSTGGTGTGTGTGPLLPPLLPASDDFSDPETLAAFWQIRDVVEGTPAQYTTLDIDLTRAGYLTVLPTTSGWYNDFDGPFVYTLLSGDFMVETEVEALDLAGAGPPTQFYNSAGIMIRDPNHGPGIERWLTHNVGFQDNQIGTERKNTAGSASQLVITPGVHKGRLRMCRVGSTVVLTRRLDDEAEYTEAFTYNLLGFPDEVQVGMNVTAWNSLSAMPDFKQVPDLLAQWNYIRLYEISDTSACFINDP